MSTRYCAFCEDPVGDDHVEIDEDPILETQVEAAGPWIAHASCWRRHEAALDSARRMFENLDKDSEERTDVDEASVADVDEDELDSEVEEIEEKLEELLDEVHGDGV